MTAFKCNRCGCICYAGETGVELILIPDEDRDRWEAIERCPECGSTDLMEIGDGEGEQ